MNKKDINIKVSIPKQLKTDDFRFIKLIGKTKNPQESDFTKAAHFAYDDPALLRHLATGYNYGILGGQGGFIEIDADHEPLITELKNKLPKTLTIETPHGGFHKYLKTDDPHTGALLDTIEDTNGGRANIGHVTGYGRQVVGPGCSIFDCPKCGAHGRDDIKGTGAKIECLKCGYKGWGEERGYTIEEDVPVAEISWADLSKIIGVYMVAKKRGGGNDKQEETKYTFANEKYQNIMDVIANPEDFEEDGDGRYRGFPVFSNHQKTGYFLVYAKTNTWYSHKDEKGGRIPHLIALQEKIINLGDDLKGEKWWAAIKIMEEKYGITIQREEQQQSPKSDIRLRDVEDYKNYGKKKDGAPKYEGLNYKRFADDLIAIYHFKTLRDTEQILGYKGGYFQYNGEAVIKEEAEEIFGALITTHGVSEIIGHIQRSTHIDRDDVNAEPMILNLENGLFDTKANIFTCHTPEHIITTRIPVRYDPAAECPRIKIFLKDVVENQEDATLLEEILGFCLYRRYFIKKAIMLTGGGDNGKSIYLNLIEHFLGKENCSSIVLQKLTLKDRFTNAFLVGMLANIAGDLSSDALKDTGMFKMLTGGDYVPAEIKGGKIFKFLNTAKMLFSANEIPETDDLTSAFWTRWIIINFPHTFVDDPKLEHEKKKIAEELLLEKITTPEEMSGFLNLALDSLRRLLEKRIFSYGKTTEEIEEEYRTLSSNIFGFVKEWCETGFDKKIPKTDFYNAYTIYCEWKKKYPETKNMLGRELPRIITVDGKIQPKIAGKQVEAWGGVSLNEKFFAFIENNKGDNGNNGYFSFSKINQIKNINKPHGGRKEKKCHFCHYDHYEIDQITPELLNNDFENLGAGKCEGCDFENDILWSVIIGDTEGGFCIDCIKHAIEQEREKKERKKQEKVGKKQKPTKGLNLKDDRSEVDKIIGDRKDCPQEEHKPVEIINDIADEKGQCEICGYGEKWGVKLPYLVFYSKTDKSNFKTVCKRCGERIMHDYNLKLSEGGEQ